ncbi:DUF4190 domain-containing protein [Streptomyces sp. AK02-01A]|uniref:DUF4190 domain-containing protein n=1 Tax=Streptomyces sp. AK02-01A TaxID=3028648 RepID=UPI0029B1295C|nr:DUF4190 domain-containing protein [Streptomyces sp. AK02-01A]MDX3851378.1 DUF4190 domain-containing protein [Streptomyces sp. AK02-01A]
MSQFTQQPYPQGPLPGQPDAPRQARNGLGVAALVLGIIGALSGLVPFLFWLAAILGLIGLILGLTGRGRAKRGEATNKAMATTGVVLGLVSMILSVVGGVLTFKIVGDVVDDIDQATSSSSADKGGAREETLAARDSAVYDDGLTVTVSAPEPYSPSATAAGHTAGHKAYQVTLVIKNDGKKKFDATLVSAEARAGDKGVKAEEIFDDTVGQGFNGTVMPGRTVTAQLAFDTPATARTLTVEIHPGLAHDSSQWDLKL